jgi:hypothetical protein
MINIDSAEDDTDDTDDGSRELYHGCFQLDGLPYIATVYSSGIAILDDGTMVAVDPQLFANARPRALKYETYERVKERRLAIIRKRSSG